MNICRGRAGDQWRSDHKWCKLRWWEVISETITPGRGSSHSWLSDPFMKTAAITTTTTVLSPLSLTSLPPVKMIYQQFLTERTSEFSLHSPLHWLGTILVLPIRYSRLVINIKSTVIFSWTVRKGIICPGQTVVYQTVYVYHGDGRWLCWMIRGDPGRLRTGISEIITKSSNCPGDQTNILNAKSEQLPSPHPSQAETEGLRIKAQQ